MEWPQLLKIVEDGFEQYKYPKQKHRLLTQQPSNLEEASLRADVAEQPGFDLMRHHFTNLATKCFGYMDALAYMLHAVYWQRCITQLDGRLGRTQHSRPDVKELGDGIRLGITENLVSLVSRILGFLEKEDASLNGRFCTCT